MNDREISRALNVAYNFLSYRPRTEQEMRSKLIKKGFNCNIIEAVITKLKEYSYLNDREFCINWLDYCLRVKPMGKSRLIQELIQREISPRLAREVVYERVSDELEEDICAKLINKKLPKYINKKNGFNRLKIYLIRRGFNIETVNKLLKEIYWDHLS